MGSSRPVCFFNARLSLRRKAGTAAHSDCSTMCSPPLASVASTACCHCFSLLFTEHLSALSELASGLGLRGLSQDCNSFCYTLA